MLITSYRNRPAGMSHIQALRFFALLSLAEAHADPIMGLSVTAFLSDYRRKHLT